MNFDSTLCVSILINTPVDCLFSLYSRTVYYRKLILVFGLSAVKLTVMLEDRIVIDLLKDKYGLRECDSFDDFLDAYDRRFIFTDMPIGYVKKRWMHNYLIDEIAYECENIGVIRYVLDNHSLGTYARLRALTRLSYDVRIVEKYTKKVEKNVLFEAIRQGYDLSQYEERPEWLTQLKMLTKRLVCAQRFDIIDRYGVEVDTDINVRRDACRFGNYNTVRDPRSVMSRYPECRVGDPNVIHLIEDCVRESCHRLREMCEGLDVNARSLNGSRKVISALNDGCNDVDKLGLFRWFYREGFDLLQLKPNWLTLIVLTEERIPCPYSWDRLKKNDTLNMKYLLVCS